MLFVVALVVFLGPDNANAGVICVTIHRVFFFCSASRDAIAFSCWPASWQKVAGPDWLPRSKPWLASVAWIVDPPDSLEQLRVADLRQVDDPTSTASAWPVRPLRPARRSDPGHAPGIADSGLQHPVDLAEGRLDDPETSCGEGRARLRLGLALERRCQPPGGRRRSGSSA